ncbi:hypothetical protein [Pectobacterium brasiliense]|uniref:hypothetical protein n=1 Tax=Pectobacterium brasiliense TaxID=180957 RepID=UPI0004E779EF|nr:hypothetical protein [Pectobacterium brasiliense]KFF67246.1 hypothetical protein IW00_09740 [Pectobacterium brasiliense]
MLTLKIVSPNGGEEIHSAMSIGYSLSKQNIAVSGINERIALNPGDVAYVINASGNTISRYENHAPC